jgi:protein pelota
VKQVDYYAQNERLTIEVKGVNIEENELLQIGKHHSFSLELEVAFTVYKGQWDRYHRNIVREIEEETQDCEVGAIVMDLGLAHICYVKTFMTLVKQKIERNIPRKGAGRANTDRMVTKFYEECLKGLLSMDHDRLKCIIIGSPGFVKDNFYEFIKNSLQAEAMQIHSSILPKILLVHTHSGFKSSLVEALQDETVINRLKDTKSMRETRVLDSFYKMLMKNSHRVAYGDKDVCRCFN